MLAHACAPVPPRAPQEPARTSTAVATPHPTAEKAPPSPPPPPPTLDQLLCAARQRCTLVGPVGQPLPVGGDTHVVERLVVLSPPAEELAEDEELLPCDAEEFWFVARGPEGEVRDYQLLTGGCTGDEASERWCGRPPTAEVNVEGERVAVSWFTPQFQCMGAMREMGDPVYSLATFELVERGFYSYHSLIGTSHTSTFRFDTRVGSESFSFSPVERDPDQCPSAEPKPNLTVPWYVLDAGFEEGDWATTDIEACAGLLTPDSLAHAVWQGDSSEQERQAKPRTPPERAPVTLLALATPEAMYLELRAEQAPSASAALELCSGGEFYHDSSYCQHAELASCTTFDLQGVVKKGEARVQKATDILRFRITESGVAGSFFLRYRDRARGIDLRTSTKKPGERFALSSFALTEDSHVVECDRVADRLVFSQKRPAGRDQALTLQ